MPYVAAMYGPPPPPEMVALLPVGGAAQVQALDEQGQVWSLTEDSQVGDWLRYVQEGGTIDPYDEVVFTGWNEARMRNTKDAPK